jgi:NitT/TauT family transport system substrate-binding protein
VELAGFRAARLGLLAATALALACQAPSAPVATPAPSGGASPAPAVASPTAGPPVQIRWSGPGSINDSAIFVAQEKGYFREEGIEVDYTTSASASETIPLLASRQLDAGATASNPATFNAALRDTGVRMVADRGSTPPGFGWSAVMVRTDVVESGRYRDLADLRGLHVAMTPPLHATANAVALGRALEQVGVSLSDVQITPMPFADMNVALANRSIDAAMQGELLVGAAVRQGLAVRVKGNDELYPYQQIAALGFGPSLLQDRPEVAGRLMVGYIRGLRDYYEAYTRGRDRERIIEILMKHTSVKDRSAYDYIVPSGYHPDGYVNVDSVMFDQDWFVRHGQLSQRAELAQLVDHRHVDYALSRLGRYQP